ncbi:MAG: hypothetical protein O2964_08885 [Verrucomicrobia bacterium]|nr:hypothetical protein [Verrucomicrobiota bacterium]
MKTNWVRKSWTGITLLIAMGFLSGCKAVPLQDQRLVSKHNMTFSDSPVFAYQSTVLTQIEPGTAGSGGAQAAGCTACQ